MVNNSGIARGVKGKERIEILRLHRLLEFESVFNDYLEGKARDYSIVWSVDISAKGGLQSSKKGGG